MSNRLLGTCLVALSLSACDACYVAGSPSGKNGVLFIDVPAPMARQLENEIFIPAERAFYNNNYSLTMPRRFTYDFAGTTLELEGEGIEVLSTEQGDPAVDGSWVARIRCTAPSSQPTELRVRVMADGRPRYEDAVDVTCWEPESINVGVGRAYFEAPESHLVLLGGAFEVRATVMGNVGGERTQLSGGPIEVADPNGPIEKTDLAPYGLDSIVLRARALGKDPQLRAGSITGIVPVEIVPDEGWGLRVWTEYSQRVSGTLQFAGYAEYPDGGVPLGLNGECTYRITPALGTLQQRDSECTGWVSDAADAGELCVDARGRTTCAPW